MRTQLLIASILIVIMGIVLLVGFDIDSARSGTTKATLENGLYYIVLGVVIFIIAYYIKEKKEKYTICPKCKESFNYSDLENGKCLYCENIDTIDIEEYYDDHKP